MHPRRDDPKSRLSLRACVPEDDAFLLSVFASTRERELEQLPDAHFRRLFLQQQFAAQRSHYALHYPDADLAVVLERGTPVGRLYVARRSDEVRILDLTLLPERRNAGIGSRLLGDLMAEAERASVPVRIYVETFNPSLRLFERLGFVAVEENGYHLLLEWRPAQP
jgi:GNAT superfamily N-acetyltransferase